MVITYTGNACSTALYAVLCSAAVADEQRCLGSQAQAVPHTFPCVCQSFYVDGAAFTDLMHVLQIIFAI
jgi:hypothetical protein